MPARSTTSVRIILCTPATPISISRTRGRDASTAHTWRPPTALTLKPESKGPGGRGALNGLLVLYHIDQHGLSMPDPNATFVDRLKPQCCSLPSGNNKSKGVDAELSGAPAPGWLIGAGYTFNNNHSEYGGDLSTSTPHHLAKLWTSNQLQGRWNRWTVGGSLQAQSSNFIAGYFCPMTDSMGDCLGPSELIREAQGFYFFRKSSRQLPDRRSLAGRR